MVRMGNPADLPADYVGGFTARTTGWQPVVRQIWREECSRFEKRMGFTERRMDRDERREGRGGTATVKLPPPISAWPP